MKIYSGPLSMFGAKVEIAAREKGVDFELQMVAFNQDRGYDPKHPEVVRINPKRHAAFVTFGILEHVAQRVEFLEQALAADPCRGAHDIGDPHRHPVGIDQNFLLGQTGAECAKYDPLQISRLES